MSKKLGLAFMFVGAYVTLLGGLFFLMHFYGEQFKVKPADYEWCWGVLTALVILIGSVIATKKYVFGIVGFAIATIGLGLTIWVLLYGVLSWNYLSPFILIGVISTSVGIIFGLICHIRDSIKAKKYGESLL